MGHGEAPTSQPAAGETPPALEAAWNQAPTGGWLVILGYCSRKSRV